MTTRGGKREGAGPKTKHTSGKAVQFTVRLSPAHMAHLELLMGYYGSRSETVAHALEVMAGRIREDERQVQGMHLLREQGF